MKFKRAFSLIVLGLLTIPALAQEGEDDSFEALTVEATVTYENVPLEGVKVQLFEGNTPVVEHVTKKNGKLKYTLYNNRIYTLQLTAQGYYPKRISISTRVPEYYDDHEKFGFEIGMVAKGGEEIEDEGLLEYPSALIGYHPKYNKFYYDTDYDRQLKADIRASSQFRDKIDEPEAEDDSEGEQ